jgi:putative flippase GtrA
VPLNDRTRQPEDASSRPVQSWGSIVRRQIWQLIPFLVTGIANSIVGFSVIFFCLFMGTSGVTANIIGFAFGLTCSFLLNRHYVFGVRGAIVPMEIARFLAVFVTAYGVNMAVLLLAQSVLGEASPIAQVIAVASYTLVFYPLSRIFVFRRENAV